MFSRPLTISGILRLVVVAAVLAASVYLAVPAMRQTQAVPYEVRVSSVEYERTHPPVYQNVPPEERQNWILLIWEEAAKAEFWVLAAAAALWVVIPKIVSRGAAR